LIYYQIVYKVQKKVQKVPD